MFRDLILNAVMFISIIPKTQEAEKKVGRDEGGQMMECHVDGEAQTMAGRGSRTM